ncbi:MAG: LysR family transcriptional regulator [Thalassolituus maritimus]|uniref:Transcriptional regulator, LysR family n=1 Tax=Thalassolituus maritimus TaxID=484498 RepID=A0A1N7MXJ4_9GAMM|nr:LysR family transcriptional regulator [Thalassolituus maritimus]TPD55395.1 MAG: LysR family transcriptional regulator [Thalassolituus maritimus]SIS90874.1 transcriptional regulator, LysR family [Thalassolituus maritimus]
MKLDPSLLSSLTWFAHIARHRSFTKAATEMEVTRGALSQQLKNLEQQLNVRLINRTTRNMSLTEEGQRLLDVLSPALESIETAVLEVGESQSEPSGLLRINSSRIATRLLLDPYLGEFLKRYPRLKVELTMNDGLSNIIAEGADAGIRLGESLDEHMVAVPVSPPIEMAIVGSPDYLDRFGTPETPEELIQHNCLGYRFSSSGIIDRWSFTSPEDGERTVVFEPNGSAIFNDDENMLNAALQGVGLIKYLDINVKKHLQEGRLRRVLSDWCKPFPGFYLYVPSRAQLPAKTRALMDFLIENRDSI